MKFLIILHSSFTGWIYGGITFIGMLDFGPRKNIHLLCFVHVFLRFRMHPNIYKESFRFIYILLLRLDTILCNLIIVWYNLPSLRWIFLYTQSGSWCSWKVDVLMLHWLGLPALISCYMLVECIRSGADLPIWSVFRHMDHRGYRGLGYLLLRLPKAKQGSPWNFQLPLEIPHHPYVFCHAI